MLQAATADLPRDRTDDVPVAEGAMTFDDFLDRGAPSTTFEQAINSVRTRDAAPAAADTPAGAEDDAEKAPAGAEAGAAEEDEDEKPAEETAKEDEAAEDEKKGEAEAEAIRAEARQEAESELLKTVNEAFPDIGAQKAEDIVAAFKAERDANDTILAVIDAHPPVLTLLQALAAGKLELTEAIAQAFGSAAGAPDKDADPDGYAAWLKAEGARDAERRAEQKRLEEVTAEIARVHEHGRKSVQALATTQKWDEGATRRFNETLSRFVEAPPDNFAEVIYRGLNHDRIVTEAVQAARADERNKTINDLKRKGATGGDGIKRFSTAAAAPDAPKAGSAAEKAERFRSTGGDPFRDFLDKGQKP